MSNFKVGQKVVCIEDNFRYDINERLLGVTFPLKNEIYTIRAIKATGALLFKEIVNPEIMYLHGLAELGFKQYRFRALDHAFADEVEAMIKEQLKEEYV